MHAPDVLLRQYMYRTRSVGVDDAQRQRHLHWVMGI